MTGDMSKFKRDPEFDAVMRKREMRMNVCIAPNTSPFRSLSSRCTIPRPSYQPHPHLQVMWRRVERFLDHLAELFPMLFPASLNERNMLLKWTPIWARRLRDSERWWIRYGIWKKNGTFEHWWKFAKCFPPHPIGCQHGSIWRRDQPSTAELCLPAIPPPWNRWSRINQSPGRYNRECRSDQYAHLWK